MRYLILVLLCLLSSFYGGVNAKVSYTKELDSIFSRLDQMVLQDDDYRKHKEERIRGMRMRFETRTSLEDRYHANGILYEEYYVYNADSAMAYVEKNLDIAQKMQREDWLYTWQINKSFLFAVTGLLREAENELTRVPVHKLSDSQLTDYYGQMMYLWSHFGQYTGNQSEEVQRIYLNKERLYRDSINMVLKPEHPLYLWYKGCYLQIQGVDSMRKVLPKLEAAIESSTLSSRYDAMNAYILGSIYRDLGNQDNYMKYLAYSSMADIVSCNKDIASLEELGQYLFEKGDIDRAYAYMNYCFRNALFFKNRVRIMGISEKINRINAIFQERSHQYEERLLLLVITTSVLSVVLLLSIIYIYKKLHQLKDSRARLREVNNELNRHVKELSETHLQLQEVNDKLNALNAELKDVNIQLRETNYVKEEYIGYVFSICSNYINKLNEYRKNINRKIKTNQLDDVKVMTDNPLMVQKELKEFYRNFDTIFLHIYPDFVSDFNALLQPEEQIIPKEGELLNTELRIYALVRLGINDSVKIADFLHCSPQTIYNNRLKVRNKTIIPKEKFVETVRFLGKVQNVAE